MRQFLVLAVIASSILLGCSDPTSADIASSAAGSWSIQEHVPGNFFGMTLVANGTALSGTGTFVGEAGPGGSSIVVGAVTNGDVNLDFTLLTERTDGTDTSTAHFSGRLMLGQLRGTLQFGLASPDNPPSQATFIR